MRWVWAIALLAGAGCGYRFTAGGAPLPEGIRTVCAPVFFNRTAEPELEVFFTQALRERLLRAGRLGRLDCDGRVEGEILSVFGAPTVLSSNQPINLASYRLYATIRLRLLKGARVVSEAVLSGTEDFLPGADVQGDVLQTEANRQAALRRLSETMARDGYLRLSTAW